MLNFIRNFFNDDPSKAYMSTRQLRSKANTNSAALPPHIVITGPGKSDGIAWHSHYLADITLPAGTILEIEDDKAALSLCDVYAQDLKICWSTTPDHLMEKDQYRFGNRMLSIQDRRNNIKSLVIQNGIDCRLDNSKITKLIAFNCVDVSFNREPNLKSTTLIDVNHPRLSDNPALESLLISGFRTLKGFDASDNPRLRLADDTLRLIPVNYAYAANFGNDPRIVEQKELMITDGKRFAYDTFHGTRDDMLAQMDNYITENKRDEFFQNMHVEQYNAVIDALGFPADKKRPTPQPILN